MNDLRPYQRKAVDGVTAAWARGVRSVCVVAPPGAGKTHMAMAMLSTAPRVLWLAPRREIVDQTEAKLQAAFGFGAVARRGARSASRSARIAVSTIQAELLAEPMDGVTHVVADECHHDVAEQWSQVFDRYGSAAMVGLTATPERADGRPLGALYERIVVAATYRELVASGHLRACRLVAPVVDLKTNLAADPVEAWCAHSEGRGTIVYTSRVNAAREMVQRFAAIGVRARVVSADTPEARRMRYVEEFRRGVALVLVNVYALTEGLHLPTAGCVMLARNFGHVGPYLQATGRVLSTESVPAVGDGIVIDLVGSSLRHGSPVADREWSLDRAAPAGGDGVVRDAERSEYVRPSVVPTELRVVERGVLPEGVTPRPVHVADVGAVPAANVPPENDAWFERRRLRAAR